MHDSIIWRAALERRGTHESAARLSPVARLDVDVFAPQTCRAMIGKSGATNFCPAMFTREIFNAFYKNHWIVAESVD